MKARIRIIRTIDNDKQDVIYGRITYGDTILNAPFNKLGRKGYSDDYMYWMLLGAMLKEFMFRHKDFIKVEDDE